MVRNFSEKTILDLKHEEAREFFLRPKCYFSGNLPSYFNFKPLIDQVSEFLSGKSLSDIKKSNVSLEKQSNLSHPIMINKTGEYAWRQLQLIHPVIYVDLVNLVTEKNNWEIIKGKFKDNQENFGHRIKCLSMPIVTDKEGKELRDTVLNWWVNSEQALIKSALDYNYCIQTDITDCYPSIYLPTLIWSLHGKEKWLQDKSNRKLLGSQIEEKLKNIQNGKDCGLPQGSVLMDFFAEMILNLADEVLYERIEQDNSISDDYFVFRYRDDYKILANSASEANKIMKHLSLVLYDLNLKLNASKSYMYSDVLLDGIKPDKLYWTTQYESFVSYFPDSANEVNNLQDVEEDEDDQVDEFLDKKTDKKRFHKISIQKHLLQIKILGKKFPNCGQLKKALTDLYKYRIFDLARKEDDLEQMLSITVSIMLENPTAIQHCVVIISRLLEFISGNPDDVNDLLAKIFVKFSNFVNTDIVNIWLQRIALISNYEHEFDTELCRFQLADFKLWNSDWLKEGFKINDKMIIDSKILEGIGYVVPVEEVDSFSNGYDSREE